MGFLYRSHTISAINPFKNRVWILASLLWSVHRCLRCCSHLVCSWRGCGACTPTSIALQVAFAAVSLSSEPRELIKFQHT
jgi:hypothetical protein